MAICCHFLPFRPFSFFWWAFVTWWPKLGIKWIASNDETVSISANACVICTTSGVAGVSTLQCAIGLCQSWLLVMLAHIWWLVLPLGQAWEPGEGHCSHLRPVCVNCVQCAVNQVIWNHRQCVPLSEHLTSACVNWVQCPVNPENCAVNQIKMYLHRLLWSLRILQNPSGSSKNPEWFLNFGAVFVKCLVVCSETDEMYPLCLAWAVSIWSSHWAGLNITCTILLSAITTHVTYMCAILCVGVSLCILSDPTKFGVHRVPPAQPTTPCPQHDCTWHVWDFFLPQPHYIKLCTAGNANG